MSATSSTHLAAVLPQKGGPFVVQQRPTPTPGPKDLLIQNHSVAVNPIDHYQRDFGFPNIAYYPSVVGSDIGGVILAAGSAVDPSLPHIPGTRVAAAAPCFYTQGHPDVGALQERSLVPAVAVTPIPASISFNEAATLPMAVATAWAGIYTAGIPRTTSLKPADKQGFLVWGAAGSVGSASVQVARILGFTVYATASAKHHAYIRELGASQVFDYHDADAAVQGIVAAAKKDGVSVKYGFSSAAGTQTPSMKVLQALKGGDEESAVLASAKPLPEGLEKLEGVEVKFVRLPDVAEEREEYTHFIFNVWLKEKLASGEYVPSPKVEVVEGGLEAANKALDKLKAGVSGVKLVLEL